MKKSKKLPYVLGCSGGKDSVATLLLAKLYEEPLDEVLFAEVMFNKETSGEYPEHIEFIKTVLKPWVEQYMGVPFTIVHGSKTYCGNFKHVCVKGKNRGKRCGYLLRGKCAMNGYGKRDAIRNYLKDKYPQGCYEYVGIAVEEKPRLERLHKHPFKRSLLEKYGYTEQDAKDLCEAYGLYSPSYEVSKRNGCWFCPNIADTALAHIVDNHTDLVNKLMALEFKAQKSPENFAAPMFRHNETFLEAVKRLQEKGLSSRRLIWVDFTGVRYPYEDD